jgi:DNA-directed RNA polymerase subunit M/transcription elongation factor TFIIS
MDCPRCDRPLERYALAGSEAVYCGDCGYIGVPVEHRGELREVESWDDAITRFHEVSRVRAGTVETTGDPPPAVEPAGLEDDPEPTVVRIESPGPDAPAGSGANGEADEHGTTGVTCDVCGKRFEEQAQLDGHSAVHSDRER